MKRILLSLGMIVFVGGLVVGATGAFFSDTETSTGNTFAAGDIDLQIDNESYAIDCNIEGSEVCTGSLVANPNNSWDMADLVAGTHKFFEFFDIKPGDYGEDTISIHVGSNDAWMCAATRLTADDDNSITEPEAEGGDTDVAPGLGTGDLDSELNFAFWVDDGDNVFETDEETFLTGPLSDLNGAGQITLVDSNGGPFGPNPIPGDSEVFIGKMWCAGELTPNPVATGDNSPLQGTGWTCDGSEVSNVAQTDSVEGDIQFYATQARNNGSFSCSEDYTPEWSDVVEPEPDNEINQGDLATSTADVIANPNSWFFYNDTNDTIMTIDQFAGDGGENHMESVDGVEGAKMTLHEALGRYNIATTKYGGIKLSDISSLSYRIYDASSSSETPFLHFNIDFNDSNTWQSRLVQVPTGVTEDTWTTVDALSGSWTYSGALWPAPIGGAGTTPHTWAEILTAYPNAELNAGGLSFLGVRVGHPGPDNETSYVDWVEFDGEVNNFEI